MTGMIKRFGLTGILAVSALGILGTQAASAQDYYGGYYSPRAEHERHEWREHERHEWREHERREWREHEWREHHRAWGYANPYYYGNGYSQAPYYGNGYSQAPYYGNGYSQTPYNGNGYYNGYNGYNGYGYGR